MPRALANRVRARYRPRNSKVSSIPEHLDNRGRKTLDNLGKYAFIVGLILAVLAALITGIPWITWVIVLLGLAVGVLNVTGGETQGFLMAAIGLILSANAVASLPFVGETVTNILSNAVLFIAPAVLIVALKSLFEIAKD